MSLFYQMKKCEGLCENHIGDVIRVHIKSATGLGVDWGEWNYCQTAIEKDKNNGFIVTIVNKKETNEN